MYDVFEYGFVYMLRRIKIMTKTRKKARRRREHTYLISLLHIPVMSCNIVQSNLDSLTCPGTLLELLYVPYRRFGTARLFLKNQAFGILVFCVEPHINEGARNSISINQIVLYEIIQEI